MAMRDPMNPSLLNMLYDSGDGLHPNVAGHQHIADAINPSLFQ
jgi:lysophospholipase L1-like esterase